MPQVAESGVVLNLKVTQFKRYYVQLGKNTLSENVTETCFSDTPMEQSYRY